MSDEDVRKLKLGGIARSLARLRLDELMSDTVLTSLLSVGSDRELKFNKELLDTTPPPLPEIGTRRIIHSKRLGCPAIHVANLIDLIIDIEKDIVVDLKNR